MKKLLALILLTAFSFSAQAASKFWVPLVITGAVSGTGGLCRLTVNDTSNLSAGATVIVSGILGATACDGTTTVTTVVNSTTVEVNLAFGLTYTSGGTVAGGIWTSTGSGNWSATSGGAGGQPPPNSADTVTFDSLSGGGTITLNFGGTITAQSLTMGAFTGTLDNSVNNNNMVLTAAAGFNCSGSSTRTLKMGSATYTLSTTNANGVTPWNFASTTNLTLLSGTSTIVFSGATSTGASGRNFTTGSAALTFNNLTFSGAGNYTLNQLNNITFNTLTIGGQVNLLITQGTTYTMTSIATTSSNSTPASMASANAGTAYTVSIASGSQSMSNIAIKDGTFTGGATFAASPAYDLGNNSGITITPPSSGGSRFIGGWLLQRDILHNNDNSPMWLEKTA